MNIEIYADMGFKMKGTSIFIQIFLCIFLLSLPTESAKIADNLQLLAKTNNQFGIELYQQLKSKEKNLFFSPFSIYTIFAIAYAGSDKQTKKEIAKVLHFPSKEKYLHISFSKILSYFNNISKKTPINLNVINSLWAQKDYNFSKTFINLIKKYYNVSLSFVDFTKNIKSVEEKINIWIQNKTHKKIKTIITPGMITPLTRLIFCNVIYFKAPWYLRFNIENTIEDDFYVSLKEIIKVPMMRKESYFKFKDFGEFRAIELPYENNILSMIIFLPNRVTGLADLENKLTFYNVKKWINELMNSYERKVLVYLPKFKITYEIKLAKILAKIGLNHLSKDANFTKATKIENIFIGKILHKTFINVNESGTEVVATTLPILFGSSIKKPVWFKVNHPFLFLIRENKTGTILFIGRIINPLSSF